VNEKHDTVLIVDFGSPYTPMIARRVREARVYCEIVPHTTPVADVVARAPKGVILVGVTKVDDVWRKSGIPAIAPKEGQIDLHRFLFDVAGCRPTWTPANIVAEQVASIKQQVGDGRVLCALSGGVDSAVTAALIQRAVGSQLTCVFVDHGLLRAGEVDQVRRDFVTATGVDLVFRDESDRFLAALDGVTDPEQKRKIIGATFIRVFEDAARAIASEKGVDFLAQGTIYPDVIESAGAIKAHHNVGGLPDDLNFELIEPLYYLFKYEVRAVGLELGLPEAMVWRHPFPGPGLGVRVVGALTRERLDILRGADAIVREEIAATGLDRKIWQFPVILLADVRSTGVQHDKRTYGYPVVLRPITSTDAMTADWYHLPYDVLERISTRITSECPQINRVVLDVTNKPPATIEWE